MGEYLSPAVYVEEVSSGAKPIAGAGTSTGAFVGIAEVGPINQATLITNWTQFVNTFGSFIADGYLAYSVFQFFNEGGTKCYVVRVVSDAATASVAGNIKDSTGAEVLKVEAVSPGRAGNNISVEIAAATDEVAGHFNLLVKKNELVNGSMTAVLKESFVNLSMLEMDNGLPNAAHVEAMINDSSAYIRVEDLNSDARPANGTHKLAGGEDKLEDVDFIGDEAKKTGLHAFDTVDDINIVAIPDKAGDREVILSAMTYCQNRADCFFVADCGLAMDPAMVREFKEGKGTWAGENAFNSSFGALYYPWIKVADPLSGTTKLTPPSGAIVGTYSSCDVKRGVHKAPAGTVEGYLNSAMGIERIVTKGEHDTLNPVGVNVIRAFPGTGICVWGALTTTTDAEWKYVNVRRLFLFLEESIDEGTQWVVFEPNDPSLWGSVNRNITAFLTRVWRDGALFGKTPDEAFFVKIDEENNPPAVRDAGQLIIEIGVAPVKPAEFVIIRIQQKTLTK
ncbi:MAG: phage tail sheath C-terminal domain-containing protein [Desulfurivibrionaceae bacterium]